MGQQVEGRADAARAPRVEGVVDDLPDPLVGRGRAQPAVERALDEAVAVLDRRGLGDHGQHREVGDQEEVDDVERGPGPEIEQHHVHVQGLDPVQDPHLLGVLDVGRAEKVGGSADEPQPRRPRVDQDLLDGVAPALDEVAQGVLGVREAQARVQVGPPEVGVHQHHPLAHPCELPPQGGGEDGLADSPLAAPHGPDLPARPGEGRRHHAADAQCHGPSSTLRTTRSRRSRVSADFFQRLTGQ